MRSFVKLLGFVVFATTTSGTAFAAECFQGQWIGDNGSTGYYDVCVDWYDYCRMWEPNNYQMDYTIDYCEPHREIRFTQNYRPNGRWYDVSIIFNGDHGVGYRKAYHGGTSGISFVRRWAQ